MQTYISYLKNVLGIHEFLSQPVVAEAEPVALEADKKWRVLFLTQQGWTANERSLFLKITEAMKLHENDFVVHEINPEAVTEVLEDIEVAQSLVCFSFELKSALEALGYHPHFSPDPKSMMKNPGLKKEAWDVLKKL